MSLRGLWSRLRGAGGNGRRDRLAAAIARVGPLNPEPGMDRFSTSEQVEHGGQTVELSILVPSDDHDPRWLDVTRNEDGAFTHYRFHLLPDSAAATHLRGSHDADGRVIDVPIDDASDGADAQDAWRMFDLGLALLHRHCEARDAAHAAWRAGLDREAARQVIAALFGPWDHALRTAMRTYDLYTGPQAPDPPRVAGEMNRWLWLHVMAQAQRTGRPLVEFTVDNDGRWVADRCREQQEPAWAREFAPRNERRCSAEQIGIAFDAFLSQRGWRLLMYGPELGKPLPAATAETVMVLARRVGFDDLALLRTTRPG